MHQAQRLGAHDTDLAGVQWPGCGRASAHRLENSPVPPYDDALVQRLRSDLVDSRDEELELELELELEDRREDALSQDIAAPDSAAQRDLRRTYFHELFRMQAELVKLQDWVVRSGHKLVILFEVVGVNHRGA